MINYIVTCYVIMFFWSAFNILVHDARFTDCFKFWITAPFSLPLCVTVLLIGWLK